MSKGESYADHVGRLEDGLATYAKRSFEPFSPIMVDGQEAQAHYQRLWESESNRLKLLNRTPMQLERDRILYSDPMRKLTEKYHVLYNGQRRIVRNYTTHTMRMAQVTRSICRALDLNADFGEAIAIGSKVGAVPFVHAAKDALSEWAEQKLITLDRAEMERQGRISPPPQIGLDFGNATLPQWLTHLRSESVRVKVQRFVPWAAGDQTGRLYSSGAESYWLLATNPYVVKMSGAFSPETMYGIWRHTRGQRPRKDSFHHRFPASTTLAGAHQIRWDHATYEATVVQYADDITWAIENLNDANIAALLNNAPSMYTALIDVTGTEIPGAVLRALNKNDAGALYTYFITDFVSHSTKTLGSLAGGERGRGAMREGAENSWIGLSSVGEILLNNIIKFLHRRVFEEPRVRNRATMLKTVAVACASFLYDGKADALPRMLRERALLEKWSQDDAAQAMSLVDDDVHRVQVALDILAGMGDQEIYDFVGIQAL